MHWLTHSRWLIKYVTGVKKSKAVPAQIIRYNRRSKHFATVTISDSYNYIDGVLTKKCLEQFATHSPIRYGHVYITEFRIVDFVCIIDGMRWIAPSFNVLGYPTPAKYLPHFKTIKI